MQNEAVMVSQDDFLLLQGITQPEGPKPAGLRSGEREGSREGGRETLNHCTGIGRSIRMERDFSALPGLTLSSGLNAKTEKEVAQYWPFLLDNCSLPCCHNLNFC